MWTIGTGTGTERVALAAGNTGAVGSLGTSWVYQVPGRDPSLWRLIIQEQR